MGAKHNLLLYLLFVCVLVVFLTFKFVGFVTIATTPSEIEIISEGINVIYDEFKGIGATTGLAYMNDTELETISSLTLENLEGKIVFSEIVNLTENENDNIIDLDSSMEISDNYIEINTSNFTSLAKPATISLYGLSLSDPRILKDGAICNESECTIQVYSGGILVFNVSNFSNNYAAEEIPSVEIPAGPGGGGGSSRSADFSISPDVVKTTVKQGEISREVVRVINRGNVAFLCFSRGWN